MIKVVCMMRTHNSEWIINQTLEALENNNIPVVIHDDASTDKTVKIAKTYSNVLEVFVNEKKFYHEGIDKSILLNMAKKYNPDWLLVMDDDEVVPDIFGFMLEQIEKKYGVGDRHYLLPLVYLWGSNSKVRIDGSWKHQLRTKLFPNTKEAYFLLNKCHCTIQPSMRMTPISCPILHYGYNSKKLIKEKYNLYKEFGEGVNGITDQELERAFNKEPVLMDLDEALTKKPWEWKK